MLQKNPLSPPRPHPAPRATEPAAPTSARRRAFLSAEDFDGTGVLAGLDPCESRYWWIPELAPPDAAIGGRDDATQATSGRRTDDAATA